MPIVLPQTIKMKWTSRNKKYFQLKGYIFTKYFDEFEINIMDLKNGSHEVIQCQCDYCNKIISKEFRAVIKDINNRYKLCCGECQPLKNRDLLLLKYNVENVGQLSYVRDKVKNTCLSKYGVENISQIEEIKSKKIETCLKNHGVENGLQLKEKIEQTYLEKYGEKHPFKSKKFIEKQRENGYKFGFERKEVQKKIHINANKTMYKNVTFTCSTQQKYLHNLLGGELNYPVELCALDIAYPQQMIYIEYDGSGHGYFFKFYNKQEEFNFKELKRKQFLQNRGWKLIRIISQKDWLPFDEIIKSLIQECKDYLKTGRSWIEIDIDNSEIRSSELNKKIELGKLRKIKKEDVK